MSGPQSKRKRSRSPLKPVPESKQYGIASWLWGLLSPFISVADALPLLRTSSAQPRLKCLGRSSRGLWNPSALSVMPLSLFLAQDRTPTVFAICLAKLVEMISEGLVVGEIEVFEFYLWFQIMPTADVHVSVPDGEHVPPSQFESARRSRGEFHSCMSDFAGNRRFDNVFVLSQPPFQMLGTSGILETDLDFGTKTAGSCEGGSNSRDTTKALIWLNRMKGAADVALVFRLHGIFALAGGDGTIEFSFGYISIRGTLVLVNRNLCEYPIHRDIKVQEWSLGNSDLRLVLADLGVALGDCEYDWDVLCVDNTSKVAHHPLGSQTILNSPTLPQYAIGNSIVRIAKS